MRLGISSYTLTWSIGVPGYEPPDRPLTGPELIRITRESGLDLLQIADNMPLHRMHAAELDELRRTADDCRVELELGTRGTEPEHLLRYLELAGLLGAGLVRSLVTVTDLALAEAQLREVLPRFEAANVVLALENHGLQTAEQLAGLFRSIGRPHLGCCLDTVNSFGALEGPEPVIRALMPHLRNLHLKDFDVRRVDHMMGYTIMGTPAGQGRLDIPRLLASAADGAVKSDKADKSQVFTPRPPTAILELWTPFTRSVVDTIRLEREWFRQSLDYLRGLGFAGFPDNSEGA